MINSAIILAGGKGERLRPFTDKVPKPMIDVLGRPLVEYQVLWLRDQGINHIIFSCGYKHEILQNYFKDGAKFGIKIDYATEEKPLGRGGAFKNALMFLDPSDKTILGANGDEITVEPLSEMLSFHQQNKSEATILLVPLISQFGIVELGKKGEVVNFREKPELPHLINAGIYILERTAIERFPDVGDHEDTTFLDLVKEKKLFGYPAKTFRWTVNTLKELNELIEKIKKDYPQKLLS